MSTQKTRPADTDVHDEDQDTRGTGRTTTPGNNYQGKTQNDKEGTGTADKNRDSGQKNKNVQNDRSANDPSRLDRTGEEERKNDPTRIQPDQEDQGPDQTGQPGKSNTAGNTKSI